jgi:hypothetical protein
MATSPELRLVTPEDYPMLKTWWEGHGWPAVPQRVLPPLGVLYGEQAAGWLYMDNGGTGVAMMEWLVTNPENRPLVTVRAINAVVEFLKAEGKRMDYNIILTTCRQPALARLLNRAGFTTTDTEMTHLLGVFA